MRTLAAWVALVCGCASATGSARAPAARAGAARVEPEPAGAQAEPAPPSLPAELRCEATPDDRTFRFSAPSGGAAFRTELLAGSAALSCCLTPGAEHDGTTATVHFAIVDDEDRAQARILDAEGLDREERRCLNDFVSGWQIVPAPLSDVCVRSFDPFEPACHFPAADVTIRFPLPAR